MPALLDACLLLLLVVHVLDAQIIPAARFLCESEHGAACLAHPSQ